MYSRTFFALMLSNASLRVATMMLVALVPLYAFDLGLSPAEVGLTSTLYFATAALSRPLAGWLVDAKGRWMAMLLGVSLFTIGTGLYLLSLPVWLFLALRALQGAGFSLNSTAVGTLATDIIPEQKLAEGLGILSLEQTVVTIFAPGLALTLREVAGYETAFGVALAFCLMSFLLRIPLAKPAKEVERRRRASMSSAANRGFLQLVEKDAWRPATVMLCFMFGTTCVNTFLAAYGQQQGLGNVGFFFVASGVALAISRLLMGRLRRRMSLTAIVCFGVLFSAGSMALIYFSASMSMLIIAGACFGLGAGVVSPAMNSISVLSAKPEARGKASATYFFALDVSTAVGAWVLGLVASAYSLREVFAVSGVLVLGALLLILWLHCTQRLPRKGF